LLGKADGKTVEVADFIHDWFGRFQDRSGDRYKELAAALYPLFRHGLAHQRHPGLLDTGDGRSLGWALSRGTDRGRHLVLRHGGSIERATGRRIGYILAAETDLLFADTVEVFRAVEKTVALDDSLAKRIHDGAWKAKTRHLEGRAERELLPRVRAARGRSRRARGPRVPKSCCVTR